MNPRAALSACLAALFLPPSTASAQERAARSWSEARVVQRAATRAPLVQRALASSLESRALAAYGAVPIIGNPTVALRAMVGVPDAAAATYSVLLGLPVDVSGARGHWSREASWATREADALLRAATNDARLAARHAWIEVATAEVTVALSEARATTAREAAERMRARFEAQASNALDLTLAEREQSEAELNALTARRARAAAASQLVDALDLDPNEPVFVEPVNTPSLPAALTRERAIALARARRAEAAAFGAAAMRLRSSVDRVRAQAVSPVLVAAAVEYQSYSQSTFGASVQWSLPLAQTAQGERATAAAQAELATTQQGLAERDQGRQAAAAWDALASLIEELRTLDERAVPSLRRTLALTETLFQAGSTDYFRVLVARQELAAMELRRVSMLRDALRARAALDHSVGAEAL